VQESPQRDCRLSVQQRSGAQRRSQHKSRILARALSASCMPSPRLLSVVVLNAPCAHTTHVYNYASCLCTRSHMPRCNRAAVQFRTSPALLCCCASRHPAPCCAVPCRAVPPYPLSNPSSAGSSSSSGSNPPSLTTSQRVSLGPIPGWQAELLSDALLGFGAQSVVVEEYRGEGQQEQELYGAEAELWDSCRLIAHYAIEVRIGLGGLGWYRGHCGAHRF
jgi:hypothetical protein